VAFALQILGKGCRRRRQGNPLRGLASLDLDPDADTPSELLRRAKAKTVLPSRFGMQERDISTEAD
jgi:hypothetical protein